jgi:peptidyl-prolyl cis-trans isomerase SurA
MPIKPKLLTLWLIAVYMSCASAQVQIDQIVAVVDEDIVMQSELDAQRERVVSQLRSQGTQLPPPTVLEKQILERLILQKLQLQLALRTGVEIDEETLTRAITGMAGENGLTMPEFRGILEEEGVNFGKFRREIREELLISQLRQREINNRVRVSDREIDNQLVNLTHQGDIEKQYQLHHILIATGDSATQEETELARQRAEDVLQRLNSGEDFSDLAITVSDGQQALDGGDLGWRAANALPSLFTDFALESAEGQAGKISEIMRNPSGFHIIKFSGTRITGERVVVKQTHARHILIKPNELTSPNDARIRLEQLKLRLAGGESFEELARSHSDDRGSAMSGGDLEWVSPGDFVPEFEEIMDELGLGEVSEPFETQFGIHLLQVLERRDYDGTEEVRRAKARNIIRKRKGDEELQSWLRRLRDEAYVEYRLE